MGEQDRTVLGGNSSQRLVEFQLTRCMLLHAQTGRKLRLSHSVFHCDETTDTFRCPAGQKLPRKQLQRRRKRIVYAAAPEVCGACPMKARCTTSPQRFLHRHLYDDALQRMQLRATAEAMRLRRSTVEHPFATLKYRIFGHPRFLLRGVGGAQTEISLAVIVYNLKRMINILGGSRLQAALVG